MIKIEISSKIFDFDRFYYLSNKYDCDFDKLSKTEFSEYCFLCDKLTEFILNQYRSQKGVK